VKNFSKSGIRRGFTLIELLVALVLFGIVGAAFTRLLTTQGSFFGKQGMRNAARNVSRASLNRIVSDFRMIEATGGVVSASSNSLTIRVPFAIGVVCAVTGGATVISVLPVDSVMYYRPPNSFYGYSWRSPSTGVYTYVDLATKTDNADAAVCTGVKITMIPDGKTVALQPVLPLAAGLGTPVFLYRKIRYEFKASAAVPGKLGLYRTVIFPNASEDSEELVAPFASTASFKFFVAGNSTTAQANPPILTSDLRGIELHLDGMSEGISPGSNAPENAPFTTAVFFKNRID
jgi:prepilin-type N-terminal cleavage/methylation domain